MKQLLKTVLPYPVRVKLRLMQHRLFPTQGDKDERVAFEKRKQFYRQFLSPGDLCFDVGANMGNRSGAFLALGAQVVAVEPQSELCAYLRAKFGRKIKVVHKGVGEKEGTLELFGRRKYNALATFSRDWSEQGRFKGNDWEVLEKVPITTLDHLIREYGVPVFVKIDTEGFEYNVLQGLSQPVKYLSFEYMTPELNGQAIDCIRRISAVNDKVACNFSAGESMDLHLKTWISPAQMIDYIATPEFIKTDFGDIYVKAL